MTQSEHVEERRSAYQPGDAVWVFVLGTWQPAVVVDMVDSGHVLARYRRADGALAERRFSPSSVVETACSDLAVRARAGDPRRSPARG